MAILHNRNAVRFIFSVTTVVVLAGIIVFIVLARSGNSAQKMKQRSEVLFSHENHSSGIECLECHHDYDENGENILDEDSLTDVEPDEEMVLNRMQTEKDKTNKIKCASCHNEASSIKSMDAFHKKCIGCHESEKSGPVFCGECHK